MGMDPATMFLVSSAVSAGGKKICRATSITRWKFKKSTNGNNIK